MLSSNLMSYNKSVLFTLLIGFFSFSLIQVDEILELRTSFQKALTSSKSATDLNTLTAKQETAIKKAYHGVSYTLLGKHATNPIKKLEYLKKGLPILNQAVQDKPLDVEIRFLRFTVEENVPSFVQIERHVNTDKYFLVNNLKPSHTYYEFIKNYLKQSKSLTVSEKSKL
jgi:hypothetical protein